MDSDLIYAKTGSGEEAMLHRTQVTQRSLRTVLILVDGQSSVAELCTRTGNRQQTEEALAELEKGGFIVVQVDEDSLWVESKKVEEEIRAAASNNPHPLPPITNKEHSAPPFFFGKSSSPSSSPRRSGDSGRTSGPPSSPRQHSKGQGPGTPQPGDARVFVNSRPQGPLSSDFTMSEYSFPPMVVGRTSAQSSPLASKRGGVTLHFKTHLVAGRQLALSFAEQMRNALRQLKPRPRAAAPFKPIRRGRRRGSLAGTLVLTLLIVIALLSLTIVFFPYQQYLPEVEAALGQVVGRPVKAAAMRVTAYPHPAFVLEKVSVGDGDEAISANELRLEPLFTSLLAPRKMLRKATFSGVSLSAQAIAGLAALAASSARPDTLVGVERIGFEKTDILFAGRVFSGLEGEADLAAGLLRSLHLRSEDRHLELSMTPVEGRLDFSIEGVGWRPTKDSPFFFESLSVKGEVERQTLTIRAMEMRLFDGVVNGIAIFGAGAKRTVSGEFWFERLNAERLLAAAGVGRKVTGEAAGRLHFQSSSDAWETLLAALSADGDFALRRGSLRGVDFAEAVRRVPKTPVQGGVTQFEQLSGKIKVTPTEYLLSNLDISSGLMQSSGRVQIGKDAKLNGRMELKMRGSVLQTSVPLALSGSLENTVVQVARN